MMRKNEIPAQFALSFLKERIEEMRTKEGVHESPGWRGYRQYSQYIRDAVAAGCVSYETLGLSGEVELLQLELGCHERMTAENPHDFVLEGLGHAIRTRLHQLAGAEVKTDPVILHFGMTDTVTKAA